MAPVLSKEAILAGSVDQLCLPCERYLRGAQEALQHAGSAGHIENLARTRYVDKYTHDRVRKVSKWYFCEFCNVVMSTATIVGLHVQEPGHKENKLSQTTERAGDVILCGDVTVQEEAWHGLADENTCVVCNVEYEDKEAHKSGSTHVINLIQSKVCDVNNNIYRKIDDCTFHCLTCNKVLTDIAEHLVDAKHKELLQECIKMVHSKRKEEEQNRNSDILDSITKFQMEKIDINLESRTAVCKKCSINLDFNCKVIENHIEEHKNNVQIIATGITPVSNPVHQYHDGEGLEKVETKLREVKKQGDSLDLVQKVAKENGLIYSSSDNNVYCKTCYKNIVTSVKNIKEHVNGALHKNNVRLASGTTNLKNNEIVNKINTKKCNFRKVPMQLFLTVKQTIEDGISKDVLLNEKYCIDSLSFYFLTLITPHRLSCQLCDEELLYGDIEEHVGIERHDRALKETPVVMVNDSEFIREIRSESFHCGFCNVIESWAGMEEHLKSTQHKERKAVSSRRTLLYLDHMKREHEKHIFWNLLHNL